MYPNWVSGKAHAVVLGAASLLPVVPRVERRHCNQTQELVHESGSLAGEKVCYRAMPLEQVPQKQPRPVHFDSMYAGQKEEGRVSVWRTAFLPYASRWAQVGIQAASRLR